MSMFQDSLKRNVSSARKKMIAASQGWKCKNCSIVLTACYEVDHVIPLQYSGTNDDDNLAALCRECHGMKTLKETKMFLQEHEAEFPTKFLQDQDVVETIQKYLTCSHKTLLHKILKTILKNKRLQGRFQQLKEKKQINETNAAKKIEDLTEKILTLKQQMNTYSQMLEKPTNSKNIVGDPTLTLCQKQMEIRLLELEIAKDEINHTSTLEFELSKAKAQIARFHGQKKEKIVCEAQNVQNTCRYCGNACRQQVCKARICQSQRNIDNQRRYQAKKDMDNTAKKDMDNTAKKDMDNTAKKNMDNTAKKRQKTTI